MQDAGFTRAELDLLAKAKANSDALTSTEWAAMKLVADNPPLDASPRLHAIRMLHDEAYHRAKASIMEPIARFNQLLAAHRTGGPRCRTLCLAAAYRVHHIRPVAVAAVLVTAA
jgi:hypothetical protein